MFSIQYNQAVFTTLGMGNLKKEIFDRIALFCDQKLRSKILTGCPALFGLRRWTQKNESNT